MARWWAIPVIASLATGVALTFAPLVAAVAVVSVLALVLLRRRGAMAAGLLVAAAPLSRPNVLGEMFAEVGLGLAIAAAIFAVLDDHEKNGSSKRVLTTFGTGRLPALLGLAYIAALATALPAELPAMYMSALLTIGTVAAAIVVLRDGERRQLAARWFVGLVVAACLSYAATVSLWLLTSPGTGRLMVVGQGELYFPATPTLGSVNVAGVALPRFTGLGREPGWMGMYAGFAYLLAEKVRLTGRLPRAALLAGMVGTFSTGAFGVFVLAWTVDRFLRRGRRGLTRAFGLVAMVCSVWLAWAAPVLGVSDKAQADRYSVGARQAATEVGLRALAEDPFSGGQGAQVVGGVNLIAAIAAHGLMFSILILLALVAPRLGHPQKWLTTGPILMLVGTLLVAQPPMASTWVFVAAAMAYTVAATPVDGPAPVEASHVPWGANAEAGRQPPVRAG